MAQGGSCNRAHDTSKREVGAGCLGCPAGESGRVDWGEVGREVSDQRELYPRVTYA